MKNVNVLCFWLSVVAFCLLPTIVNAQITANADADELTQYQTGSTPDHIYIFCGQEGEQNGILTASGGNTYEWQKYNRQTNQFDFYFSEAGSSSTIGNLGDGCYRVRVSSGTQVQEYTAWVFNNYYSVTAKITDKDCESVTIDGAFNSPYFEYIDLITGQPVILTKDIKVTWKNGDETVAAVLSSKIYNPPTRDTDYKLIVSDRFGCSGEATVTYESIVTKASFTVDPSSGEAPLKVTFTNTSENGTPGKYEWFFYKSVEELSKEADRNGSVADSIKDIAYDDSPVYIYEKSGYYKVKLVSKKVSGGTTCTDTFYYDGYIKADTSFFDAPNVFSPNGDGENDEFVVKFWSMKKVKFTVVNRWGKVVHKWESGNVEGFPDTWSAAAWDGKIGGRYASPGVYFYVIEGYGRDDKKRWAHGFFHLFRDK